MAFLGTVGFATGSSMPGQNPILGMAMAAFTREFAAGAVGDFYEQQRELLYQPATDENIREFARRETEFFGTQPWLARNVGGLMSAETRAELLTYSRNAQQAGEQVLRRVFGSTGSE
ncbi:hypothetical protein [Myxococcus sp. RHSTA-1-4]|uniref:hypothetical protein n=1 Tax=Myxococcus sp. RHSTA-1-4 TaxID=2874601 RepID=UPI001CBC91AD|nr:hypothetical protein [Myxococcus sp. RHSTA-1-4]MBZ4419903.1 hypothetical protein [Myxococcus sp. RHSTA-1-4]